MLKSVAADIRFCLERAEDCAKRAKTERDPKLRQAFEDLARRWTKLARSYELSERLEAFTKNMKFQARSTGGTG